MALDSVQCYARMHNYEFIVIDLKNFEYNKTRCAHPDILFKRHCILADYMEKRSDLSYFLFIGADMGVVNPAHKIEEYIIPGIDLFFYYRIGLLKLTNGSFITPSVQHNVTSINYWGPFDIMADSFILRNTNYTRTFLRYWADSYYKVQYYAFFNDNPILHQVFMDYFAKDKDICFPLLMTAGTIIETYEWMACTNYVYGNNWTQEIFDDRVVIRKKYEKMWARDHGEYSIAKNKWSDRDFIAHGWKEQWRSNIDTWFPYKNAKYNFDLTLCGTKDALKNWHYPNGTRPEIKIEEAQLDKILDGWVSDVHKF
uniref:Glycosyltransferase n=1 Tax=Acrobeloides nanus TaxID=290746 RepID=A0A914D6M0_9BILA